jgi:peptidyl-prolyl cis-trans isomerase C
MSCSHQSLSAVPRTPVRVNGIVIPHSEISREVQHHPAQTPAGAWRAAALALVVREALAQEAARLGIDARPATLGDGRCESDEEARVRTLVEREVAVPEPTEEECRRYYERNLHRFRSSDLYEASHILIAAVRDDPDAYETACAEARLLIDALRERPERFADLARARSVCPSGRLGGSLGQIGKGQTTPEFDAALREIEPGEIGACPVETPYGVHVIRLERKIEGCLLPFEIVRERIAGYLGEAVKRRASAQYVARLLAGCEIEGIEVPGAAAHNVH